jgi:hypothetical protein
MSSQAGAMFENLFASEALRRGLDVSRPDHHSIPFDLIVSNSSGKLFRVQVKGTASRRDSGFGFNTASRNSGQKERRAMKRRNFDIFVGIVELPGERVFYIIPSEQIKKGRTTLRVFPKHDSQAQYERFRNAWSVFEL